MQRVGVNGVRVKERTKLEQSPQLVYEAICKKDHSKLYACNDCIKQFRHSVSFTRHNRIKLARFFTSVYSVVSGECNECNK